jgi:hypothetical protein
VPVHVEIERDGQPPFRTVADDVSLNGIRITSDASFDAAARCDVKVILGGDSARIEIVARGCVVDGSSVAVHFDTLDVEGYNHLKRLILSHAPDSEQVEREFDEHAGLRRREP